MTIMTLDDFLKEWSDDGATVMVHTSGSTGSPRPMMVDKERMRASARLTCDYLHLTPSDSALLCMPLDYIAGKMMVVRALTCGMRLVTVTPSGHPLSTLDEAPDFAAMVPMQVYNSLQVDRERRLLSEIRHLIIGGGAIDADMERQLRSFPNNIWSTYGMTETLSHVALRRLSGAEASEWYSPLPGVEISIDGRGCLVIHAPNVCPGLLHTNDMAEMDADGHRFRITGRIDNVVDSGGIKIQIEEVEQRLRPLLPYPFMIIKVSDKKFGETMALLVVGHADESESICRRVLPRYWQPAHYLSVPSLPMTGTGKPARAQAKSLYFPNL